MLSGSAAAQSPPEDSKEVVHSLLERVGQLEKRIAELEAKGGAAAAAAPTPAAAVAPAAQEKAQPPSARLAAEAAPERYPSLAIKGFADFDFSATDERGAISGFNEGQFVLHMVSPLSRKISYFGEITLNAQPTGFLIELERSIIRYDYNDNFKLSFGRYHTPINYWNTAYHHGSWLQTTISRPEMIRFGGRLLPVHFVGALAEGQIPSGPVGLNYSAGLGNGRGLTISRPGDAGDVNNNRAWLLNLFARPPHIYGLQIGGSVYRDEITLEKGSPVREWISSAHLVWDKETPEFIAEFANIRHRQVGASRVFDTKAFYVQAAYRLPWFEKRWKPYYRFEYIDNPAGENVLLVPDLLGSTVGVRYDISDFAAFKGEYRYTQRGSRRPWVNGVFLQTAFTF